MVDKRKSYLLTSPILLLIGWFLVRSIIWAEELPSDVKFYN